MVKNKINQKDIESRAQYAYRILLSKISDGTFLLGSKLVENEIANDLGLSRTPIREALKRLESEGYLYSENNKSLKVSSMTVEKANELFYMREAVEGMSARLASTHASEVDIKEMSALLEKEASTSRKEVQLLLDINDDFHRAIYRASHNRYLFNALTIYQASMEILRITTRAEFIPSEEAHRHHVDIFEAIEKGNTERAEMTARRHIRNSRRIRIELLKHILKKE